MPIYSKAIRSLLASSLGLPGMQELLAQEPPPDALEYRYTFYDEEPIPLNRLAFGDPRRYEIESHQFRIVRNLDDSLGLELNDERFVAVVQRSRAGRPAAGHERRHDPGTP